MSVQIFLQGKLVDVEPFLLAASGGSPTPASDDLFTGRSRWVSLLCEVLPRALLAELGLAPILLGASGGGQFLVVLPEDLRAAADAFLERAADGVRAMSGGSVRLIWASTENLGDWSDVRKRLAEPLQRQRGMHPMAESALTFQPFVPESSGLSDSDAYFVNELGGSLLDAHKFGWSPDQPAMIVREGGKFQWPIGGPDGVPLARRMATHDETHAPASPAELGARAEGAPVWGVLRGDVDLTGARLRRAQTVEEYLQLCVIYKQVFAGELEVVCSMPEFWRKVSILYTGGDDFAVWGAWDALIPLAREIHRLFHRFSEEYLKDFPGPEGKTLTAALALAPSPDAPLVEVFRDAGQKLETAKCAARDSFHLLGRTLEWKQVGEAAELKDMMKRLLSEFNVSPQFLHELAGFYKESANGPDRRPRRRSRDSRFEKPWRLHGHINRTLGTTREREFQRLRQNLIVELTGKGTSQWRLRPSGRVALEWTMLLIA